MVVALVLVVALIFGWFKLRDTVSDQSSAAAGTCVEGDSTLAVTVDPTIAPQIQGAAEKYNATKPVVRDHCVSVSVTAKPTRTVEGGLGGKWDDSVQGPKPALWIPQSSVSAQRASAVKGLVDGEPKSLVSSPVVLGVQPLLQQALTRANIGWQDLPRLQGNSDALGPLGLPGWGGLRLATPDGSDTSAVLDAVAAATANAGVGPLPDDAVDSPAVITAVSTLAAGAGAATGDKPATSSDALEALAEQTDRAGAPFHAVATTAQQATRVANGSDKVAAFVPAGPAPVAEYPTTLLAGDWVDETQNRSAALFVDFLRQPEQVSAFTDAGFATAAPENSLRPAALPAQDRLADLLANPRLGTNVTVLLDISSSMAATEGGGTRLGNVTTALRDQVRAASDSSQVGVWLYAKNLAGTTPYRIASPVAPLTADHRTEVDQALGAAQPNNVAKDNTYPSLIAAYKAAVAGFVPGQANSILLVTDGPDDDSPVTGQDLLARIAAAGDPAKPVRIDFVVAGPGSSSDTLQTLAQRTGGTLTALPSSAGPQLPEAVAKAFR